jgi:hypothetical protein
MWVSSLVIYSSCTFLWSWALASNARTLDLISPPQVSKLLADLSAPPSSLQFDGRTPAIPQEVSNSFFGKLAIKLLMYEDKHNQLIVGKCWTIHS